jgi:hypothetical protein
LTKVKINGSAYNLSPLRLKYLRQITEMLREDTPTDLYENLSRFFPFITISIKEYHPNFTQEILTEGTLGEISDAWSALIECSGIKLSTKTSDEKESEEFDWGFVYGRLCASVHWTYRDVEEHTLPEVSEFLDFLAEHPPMPDMYAAVHQIKPKFTKKMRDEARGILGPKRPSKEVDQKDLNEIMPYFGAPPQSIPDEVRSSIEFAEALKQKMRIH